jgi:hypothetical protein
MTVTADRFSVEARTRRPDSEPCLDSKAFETRQTGAYAITLIFLSVGKLERLSAAKFF